jgi:integrase
MVASTSSTVAERTRTAPRRSHQKRVITLPGFVAQRLVEHMVDVGADTDALLFVGRTGRALSYKAWRARTFDPAVKAAGLSGTPHDLRASHATWVAAAHGVLAAAKRLGHSNASVTTRHYARVIEGTDDDVAGAFDTAREAQPKRTRNARRAKKGL